MSHKLFECVSANLAENKPQDEFVQNFNFSESFGIVNIISASVYIYTNLGINNNIALYRHWGTYAVFLDPWTYYVIVYETSLRNRV